MENILSNLGFVGIVILAIVYVNGLAETLRAIRSIRFPRIRLTLPDWFKRDVRSLARLQAFYDSDIVPPHLFTGWEADYEIARRIKKSHPMDRTFSDACDW